MVTFLTLTRQFFLHTTPIDIINSWGISKMYATQIVKNVNGEDFTMAAIHFLYHFIQTICNDLLMAYT